MSNPDHSNPDDYYERVRTLLEDSYVAADERGDVFGGSGSSGDMASWEAKRRVIARAFDRDGTWLDVGCANGLLIETLTAWVAEDGHHIEPYGLDLSGRIADRARKRLPLWAARIWSGNVMTFEPPIRFDYVTTLADAVPPESWGMLLERVARLYLKPNGRLISELLQTWRFHAREAGSRSRVGGGNPSRRRLRARRRDRGARPCDGRGKGAGCVDRYRRTNLTLAPVENLASCLRGVPCCETVMSSRSRTVGSAGPFPGTPGPLRRTAARTARPASA